MALHVASRHCRPLNLRLAGTLGIWLLVCSVLAAADFWDDKDYTSWSAEEVEQMLTDSPWSRAVTVVVRGAGDRPRGLGVGAAGDGDGGIRAVPDDPLETRRLPGFGTMPERMTLTVSWRSALPVKQALVRAQAGIGAPIPPAQRAFLIQHEPLYVVSVAGIPRQFAEEANLQALLSETILGRRDKPPIVAEDVEPFLQSDDTVILEFAFLRDEAITLDDNEVEFITALGQVEVKRTFKLEDMVFGDLLAL